MANTSADVSKLVGFCTVRFHAEHGYFGGYLILNAHARPLEFHCTLPVKPSRAQEILYGTTLPDFVCGEQIGRALTAKAKLAPPLILTDCTAMLSLAHVSDLCVVCVSPSSQVGAANIPSTDRERLRRFELGDHDCVILRDQLQTEARAAGLWKELDSQMDISEPFQRIAEALLEAHPIIKAA